MTSSTSSAFQDDVHDRPQLHAKVHSLLSAEQVACFDVSRLKFRATVDPEEIDEIKKLHAEWFPVVYNEDFFGSLTDRAGKVLTVLGILDGIVIGMIIVAIRRKEKQYNFAEELIPALGFDSEAENTAYILTIGVVDELRRRGIGRVMLREGVRRVAEVDRSCLVIYLHVISYNQSAIELYKSERFTEFDWYESFYFFNGQSYDGILYYKLIDRRESALEKLSKWIYNKLQSLIDWSSWGTVSKRQRVENRL